MPSLNPFPSMTRIIICCILFFSTSLFAQTDTLIVKKPGDRSILIRCAKSFGVCGERALKITGETIQIDTCFNSKTNGFTADRKVQAKNNRLLSQIVALKNSDFAKLESDLNTVTECDYAAPFQIQITENNKVQFFSLKRFANCYPISAKQLMEDLDDYFEKMR